MMKSRRSNTALKRETQKKTLEELRKKNLGIGLVIKEADPAPYTTKNKKTVFDSDDEFDAAIVEEKEREQEVTTNNADNDDEEDDNSAVEEVALEDSRKAADSQRNAERITRQLHTKKRKPKSSINKNNITTTGDEILPLNEELFALIDADRRVSSKNASNSSSSSQTALVTTAAAAGKRTTFIVHGGGSSPSSDHRQETIDAGFNIDLVVLDAENTVDPMGFSIGSKPSNVALLLSRGGNLMQGLKTSNKAKYGITMRGNPSRFFSN